MARNYKKKTEPAKKYFGCGYINEFVPKPHKTHDGRWWVRYEVPLLPNEFEGDVKSLFWRLVDDHIEFQKQLEAGHLFKPRWGTRSKRARENKDKRDKMAAVAKKYYREKMKKGKKRALIYDIINKQLRKRHYLSKYANGEEESLSDRQIRRLVFGK